MAEGMDISSMIGGSGGGGGSSWGQGMSIGGMAEQDIASFLAAGYTTQEIIRGINKAKALVDPAYDKAEGYYKPYADLNWKNTQNLSNLTNAGAFRTQPMNYQFQGQAPTYTEQPFNYEQDPGYQFRLQEGQNAIQNSAAARGMNLSGATLKALDQYSSGLASQEYQNAYNRYNTNRTAAQNLYGMQLDEFGRARTYGLEQANQNWLSNYRGNEQGYGQYYDLASVGANAPGQLANLTTGRAATLGSLEMGIGNAKARGYQAAADAAIQQGQHLQEIGSQGGGSLGQNPASMSGNQRSGSGDYQQYYQDPGLYGNQPINNMSV